MKREEQIREAGIHYDDTYCTGGIRDAFESGAEWADENPKSPWISVEERLPEVGDVYLEAYTIVAELRGVRREEESIVVSRYDGAFIGDGRVVDMMGGTTCSTAHHWMPIPELPKEGKK